MKNRISRRHFLRQSVVAMGGLAIPIVVRAAMPPKLAKTVVSYQNHPKGNEKCDVCRYYIAPAGPGKPPCCQRVAGPISPVGYCVLFTEK